MTSITIRKLTCAEDSLHEAAIRKTGFSDFGDPAYLQGLRVLLDAFDSDLKLTETGQQLVYDVILRILTARLYARKGWAKHPEVLASPIHRPLVILGLPCSGTTALHKLLSIDPQFQGVEYWLAQAPMIRPPRETWEMHPAYVACSTGIAALTARVPERRTIRSTAGEVEKCNEVLMQSFMSGAWPTASSLPTYGRWLPAYSARESYRRYADVLRLIGAREPHKRWLLKSPYHMAEIDALLEAFPDSYLIQTHRDPLEAIPSLCRLLYLDRQDLEGEGARPDVIGPQQCIFWRKALHRMNAARQRRPMQFFDFDKRRFQEDPLGIVHAMYDHFGLALSLETEQQMHGWIATNPMFVHDKHEDIVHAWGFTQAQICNMFAEYRTQHEFN